MHFYKIAIIIAFLAFCAIPKTIVLQQGKEGYSGCKDTYIDNVIPANEANFGNAEQLMIVFLSC